MLQVPIDARLDLDSFAEAADYAIIGPRDSRIQVINTTRFPWNTVVHLCRNFGDGRCAGCSGVLIGPRHVLTAAHCLWSVKRKAAPRGIRVCPGRRDRRTLPYSSVEAECWYVPRGFIDGKQRRQYDFGLIVLRRPVAKLSKFMPLKAASDAELTRLTTQGLVTVAGYPSDRPLGTMWQHAEMLKRFTSRRLFYTVDTCPGHSGSPIWMRGAQGPAIIGVHTAGVLDSEGRSYGCVRGAVLAPPGMLNSGVRVTSSMLAALRAPSQARSGPESLLCFP